MLNGGRGVTLAHALTALLLAGALAWMGFTALARSGRALPAAGWLDLGLVLVLCGVVIALGLPVRRYLRAAEQPAGRAPSPQYARTVLATAQASALAGGLFAGVHAAAALVLVPDGDVPSVRHDILMSAALVAASLLLVGVGLLVQSWCRIDPRDQGRREGEAHGEKPRQAPGLYARR